MYEVILLTRNCMKKNLVNTCIKKVFVKNEFTV